MLRPPAAALTLIAVALGALALPAGAGAAAWDATGLPVVADDGKAGEYVVTTTADGAAWVATTENADEDNDTDMVVRRITPDGTVGAPRVLASDGGQYGGIAIARASSTEVRVATVTGPGMGTTLSVRRLGPDVTGDPVVLYDRATTEDGDGTANNGNVEYSQVRVLEAPSGAAWVVWARGNNAGAVLETRRLAADGTPGNLVKLGDGYEAGAAVNPDGLLISVHPSGGQGQVVARRVTTDATAEAPVVIRPSSPPSPPYFAVYETSVVVDGSGVATALWRTDTAGSPGRYVETRRFDTTSGIAPAGTGPTALTDGLASGDSQYPAALAADADGDVLAAWHETDSWVTDNDALVRELGAGALPDAIGPRLQLDGPSPDGQAPTGIVTETAEQTRVLFAGGPDNTTACRAARVGAGGALIGTDLIASGCSRPVGPPDAAHGLVAAWRTFPGSAIRLSRWVEQAPTCADGPPATVEAGRAVTLSLPCDGWRPVREITGAPARGALGAIDDAAGAVTYTAGTAAGADEVRFRAVNAAGQSVERSVSVTVTPAPAPAPGPGDPTPAPPPSPSPPGAAPDRSAPVITALAVTPRVTRTGARRAPVLTFTLSEAARVTVTVERLVAGRRSGGRCRATRRAKGAPCTLARTVATRRSSAAAGKVRLALRGAGGRALGAGRHRITVRARDAAGNTGAPVRAALLVRAARR